MACVLRVGIVAFVLTLPDRLALCPLPPVDRRPIASCELFDCCVCVCFFLISVVHCRPLSVPPRSSIRRIIQLRRHVAAIATDEGNDDPSFIDPSLFNVAALLLTNCRTALSYNVLLSSLY